MAETTESALSEHVAAAPTTESTSEVDSAGMPPQSTAASSTAANASSPTDGGQIVDATKSDIRSLQELLDKSPGEEAAWMLEQLKALKEAGTPVDSLPIFQVATALKTAPVEQKEMLISSIMQGVGDLPPDQKKEALLVLTQLPSPPSAAELGSGHIQEPPSVLSANIARIAHEAAINDMRPEEIQKISNTVEKQQGEIVQVLLDTVPELSEAERETVSKALVDRGMVNDGQRSMLEEAIKPGGHVDQLANIRKWASWAHDYIWIVWVLPVFQIIIAIVLAFSCRAPILSWLIVDALVGVGIACLAYAIKHKLKTAFKEFSDDVLGMTKRVQEAMAEGANLNDAVPGSKTAMMLAATVVGLILINALLVIMGFSQLLQTMASSCSVMPRMIAVIVSLLIMVLHLILPVLIARYAWKAYLHIKELKRQNPGAQPLVSESASSYGAVEGSPQV